MSILIRSYRPADLAACRELWRELTQRHRDIYNDSTIGGADPGLYFDQYLTRPNLGGVWVAEQDAAVVGLCGLLLDGTEGEIEPIVVSAARRSRGIGRRLLRHLIAEAKRRGLKFLNIRPVARNAEAITLFHRAGFRTLGHIQMFTDLRPAKKGKWRTGVDLHGNPFRY